MSGHDAAESAIRRASAASADPKRAGFLVWDEKVWTILRADAWRALPQTEHGYRQKLFFWSKGYDPTAKRYDHLLIQGKRLDGDAPAFTRDKGTNGISIVDGTPAIVTTIDIPTTGCWEITSKYRDHELKFDVKVEDETINRAR